MVTLPGAEELIVVLAQRSRVQGHMAVDAANAAPVVGFAVLGHDLAMKRSSRFWSESTVDELHLHAQPDRRTWRKPGTLAPLWGSKPYFIFKKIWRFFFNLFCSGQNSKLIDPCKF